MYTHTQTHTQTHTHSSAPTVRESQSSLSSVPYCRDSGATGVDFVPQGTFATSGDIFGCHNWGRGVLLAAKYPTVPRIDPTAENYQPQMSVAVRLRNPAII